MSSQIDDLRGAETGSGESGIAVDARADIGPNGAGRGAQDNLVVFRESDGQAIGASDGDGAFGDQLQHFVENELFVLVQTRRRERLAVESGDARGQRFSAAHLIVQSGEGEQRLQSVAVRGACEGPCADIDLRLPNVALRDMRPRGQTQPRRTESSLNVRLSGGRRHLETAHL